MCIDDKQSVSRILINKASCLFLCQFLTTFKPSIVFRGNWGSNENWLKPKTWPPLGNLACPNLWNALYNKTII